MTIKVTYQAEGVLEGKRYVRRGEGSTYHWCSRSHDPRYDAAQGTCDFSDLPEAVRDAADAISGSFPSYVEWPR